MKAALNNYRQSPRKVRLVADLMRGKSTGDAMKTLMFATKRSVSPLKKLLESAIANAKNAGVDTENLIVKEIQVNAGVTLKRIMPRAMGSASRINKRSSHITIVLGEKPLKKGKKAVKVEKAIVAAKTPKAKKVKAKVENN
jgi:large subunit ribosomal protein L22